MKGQVRLNCKGTREAGTSSGKSLVQCSCYSLQNWACSIMSYYDRQMRLPVVQCRRYVHQVPKGLNSNAVRLCSTFQCWLCKQQLHTCQRKSFTVLVHRSTVSFACVHAWRTGYPVQHIMHKSTLIAMRNRDDDCITLTETLKNLKRSKSA
jgi:hypothetical protein